MIVSAAMPVHIAVLCISPIRPVTLQHVRTDLDMCTQSSTRHCQAFSWEIWTPALPQSSITDFTHFSMLTRRRFALMQVVENAV
jgi:hypothetical protein